MSEIYEVPESVTCVACGQPMQLWKESVRDGVAYQRTFVCCCQGPMRYRNFHRITFAEKKEHEHTAS